MTLEEKIYEIREFDGYSINISQKADECFQFLWYLTPVALTRH